MHGRHSPASANSASSTRTAGVWLVVGVQAAGKSTVAELLSAHFDRGVHVRGGQFYRFVTRGWVGAGDVAQPEEARRLLDLRYRLSAVVASEYCAAGFTTVAQDNIFGADVVRWLDTVTARPRHLVVLRPRLEVIVQRDADRTRLTGKVAYRAGEFTVEGLDADLSATPRIGLWLGTSEQTPEETVAAILARTDEANVEAALGDDD